MLFTKFAERPTWSRRHLMEFGLACLGFVAINQPRASLAARSDEIPQPSKSTEQELIARAFEMRDLAIEQGDRGYGALVVNEAGKIVGQSPSRVVVNRDPTAHAEMEAIRDATRRLKTRDLSNHTLYSSSRACPMCEAAAFWANIDTMIYGRGAEKAGRPTLCRSG